MIEIINRQKIKRINLKYLRRHLKTIFAFLSVNSCDISIVLCDNKFIRRLNKDFFKKNKPTDVISFPLKDDFTHSYLGEIIISVEEANLRAKEYGNTWQQELLLYIIHGILHLLGYRDNTKKQRLMMERKQNEIFSKITATSHKLQATGLKRKTHKSCSLKLAARGRYGNQRFRFCSKTL